MLTPTNVYLILQIRQVKYAIYTTSLPKNDQILLEAELHMRNQYKQGLFHQSAKELWAFGLNEEEIPVPVQKFNMICRDTNIVSPTLLFLGESKDPDSKALYRVLLALIKRKILINLSMSNLITPFGDAALISSANVEYLFIDPQIASNGDVIVSCSTKKTDIFALKYSTIPAKSLSNSNYAVYLAPSGIRAYFANENLADSLTPTPSNCQNLLIMLHLLLGIPFNKTLTEVRWVKLVPDLKHLNGLTSQIGKYLRPVQNSKFVVWPLDLCFAQNGVSLSGKLIQRDPLEQLDLFSELFSLVDKVQEMELSEPKHEDQKKLDVIESKPSIPETIPLPEVRIPEKEEPSTKPSTKTPSPIVYDDGSNWNNLDEELFGEGNEIDEADFNFFDDEEIKDDAPEVKDEVKEEKEEPEVKEEKADIDATDLNNPQSTEIEPRPLEVEPNTFDIPKNEMCLPPTPYSDPGAPPPIENTSPASAPLSVFSPLKFNPAIRTAVDTKYGEGGKFHVPAAKTDSKGEQKRDTEAGDFSIVVHSSDEDLTSDSESESEEGDDDDDDDDEFEEEDEVMTDITPRNTEFPNHSLSALVGTRTEPANYSNVNTPELPATKIFSDEGSRREKTKYEVSNWVQFLTKWVPVYTVPEMFFNNTPAILEANALRLLPVLADVMAHSIITNHTHKYSIQNLLEHLYSTDTVEEKNHISMKDFEDFYDLEDEESPMAAPQSIETALHDLFPAIRNVQLAEYIGDGDILMPPTENDDCETVFPIEAPVCRVKRGSDEITIGLPALKMWRVLGLSPLGAQKNITLLLVTSSPNIRGQNSLQFINSVARSYTSCGLGKADLATSGLYEEIVDGILDIGYAGSSLSEFYDALDQKMIMLGKSGLKLEELNLVVFFLDPQNDVYLRARLSCAFGHFLAEAGDINVKLQLIPLSFYMKENHYRGPTQKSLTELSLAIYETYDQATRLTTSTPLRVNFALTTSSLAPNIGLEDLYIHLAYDRSADRNWCTACWTDQWGTQKKVRSWYCYPIGNFPKIGPKKGPRRTFEQVTNEMWQETLDFEAQARGRKAFLVLTRLGGVILDDELAHWKRLLQNSTVQIILLTVNLYPRVLFKETDEPTETPDVFGSQLKSKKFSLQELENSTLDLQISDSYNKFYGIILKNPISLPNSTNKITFKTGYLVKPEKKTVFDELVNSLELNLLSYPNFMKHDVLLKDLLMQFRNLSALGGTSGSRGVAPWHISVVENLMDTLVHLRVE